MGKLGMTFLGAGIVAIVVALTVLFSTVTFSIPYLSYINIILFPLGGIFIVLGIVFLVIGR